MINFLRDDLEIIARKIPAGSKVLDLGCGDGSLIKWLQKINNCKCYGVEISHTKVLQCIKKNVNVIQADIEAGLSIFDGNKFDIVVLSQALQATHKTEIVLKKTSELGKKVIVSIPNFGHWSHILELVKGNMPVNHRLPYEWFNTPNWHFATINDFEKLLSNLNFSKIEAIYIKENKSKKTKIIYKFPKYRCTTAIYQFSGV